MWLTWTHIWSRTCLILFLHYRQTSVNINIHKWIKIIAAVLVVPLYPWIRYLLICGLGLFVPSKLDQPRPEPQVVSRGCEQPPWPSEWLKMSPQVFPEVKNLSWGEKPDWKSWFKALRKLFEFLVPQNTLQTLPEHSVGVPWTVDIIIHDFFGIHRGCKNRSPAKL